MIPWVLLDKVAIPGNNKELRLYQRNQEYSIKINACELMNSRMHHSEDALGKLACTQITHQAQPQILIGGLGMGFTLRAALNSLNAQAHVSVAELLPAVVAWNRNFLAHLAESPLNDKRVTVYEGDVADKIKMARNLYHAIILDVDNGAQGLTQEKNDDLYTLKGLSAIYEALQSKGILAVWSSGCDVRFMKILRKSKFKVEEMRVRDREGPKGRGESVVWIAMK